MALTAVAGGIIPARAGFTSIEEVIKGIKTDHPRSRGVYPVRAGLDGGYCGSSPLARGLRPDHVQHVRRPGIIPARAGFTSVTGSDSWPAGDHPRSRGVYASFGASHAEDGGSSPLARGLLFSDPGLGQAVRIIPARAGFTDPAHCPLVADEDHPRSRGVYAWYYAVDENGVGSSPLARGLRKLGEVATGMTGDHPRSRGVYPATATENGGVPGSSPLARGLLVCAWLTVLLNRIIPARAGFTTAP